MAEPKLRSPVRKLAALRPGYLALLFVVLALVLGAFALYGLRQSQQSTLETLERGARSLAEAVSRAEENVLRAEGDMEELVEERLLDNARLLAELGLTQSFSDTLLARIAADNALDQVDVDQLHQALLNLLVNAVEATDEGHIRPRGPVAARGLGGDRRG